MDALLASFSRREGQLSVICEAEYGKEVKAIVEAEVSGSLRKRLTRLRKIGRFWPLLRYVPKAKSIFLRCMGDGAVSVPVVNFDPDRGWQKNRVYIWQRRSMVDNLLRRFGRKI